MLKPANKSLEGQSTAAVLASCVGALYYILGDDKSVSPEAIAKLATTTQDFVSVISATPNGVAILTQLKELGKLGMILLFMYKVFISFLNSRTDLKKEELRIKSGQTTTTE